MTAGHPLLFLFYSFPAFDSAGLDISPRDLNHVKERVAAEALTVRGYRFEGDRLCKPERFATLRGRSDLLSSARSVHQPFRVLNHLSNRHITVTEVLADR